MVSQLILTVTRACNLRCSYCPTAKDGWPSLTEEDAVKAVELFASTYGGGDIKLFGGEPLLLPAVVRATFEAARNLDGIRYVYLSTNGLGLDDGWLDYLSDHAKAVLTISMDGRPEDHRRHRRALPNIADCYDHIDTLRERLVRMQRMVVTQTIAPSVAIAAFDNFEHLLDKGYWRFNFLPGYYIPWRDDQLDQLRTGFERIAERIVERWRSDTPTYVRNLFTYAPTPFFNTGVVVDADRAIHPSNIGLSSALEELLGKTRIGDLDAPPTPDELAAKAASVNALLQEMLPAKTWQSTLAADRELSRFCQSLYGEWAAYRERKRGAA